MAVFGIVSEFNPFHNGHKYLVDTAKEMSADAVVCVMSGNATQRGELAMTDKYNRAEMALLGGADLVLELPYPFSSASAEAFATASIFILSKLCDTVIFGSECGNIEMLLSLAEHASSKSFRDEYMRRLKRGKQSTAAYLSLLGEVGGATLGSNDILGVEYIKAARMLGAELRFITVKRRGSAYLDAQGSDDGFDSALSLRKKLCENAEISELKNSVPDGVLKIIERSKYAGELIDTNRYAEAARLFFRLHSPEELLSFAHTEGGIAERICRLAHESPNSEAFIRSLSTKRYTDAKLRRALLFSLTSVTPKDLTALPEYTLLLGADKRGREILSLLRKTDTFKVITKPADARSLTSAGAIRQRELSQNLDTVYTFCLQKTADSAYMLRKKPYIT